jgi:group II intron reverse transcriptase/maturase
MEERGSGLEQMSRKGTSSVIDFNLETPKTAGDRCKVEVLQSSLHAKAKADPTCKFYSLWDKVYRKDVLHRAYHQCKRNRGSYGVDRQSFDDIQLIGEEKWLEELHEELRRGTYSPQPLRRVWIPKGNSKSKRRLLSIACIKDRVVQTAMHLILQPIFEADLLPEQYGFRPGVDAKMAVRRIYYHVTQCKRTGIVDADLQDYFTSIPHGDLMRCLSRRIIDGKILNLIKQWLEVPTEETLKGKMRRDTEAKENHRGVAQGSPLSPLLANCYFRRFLLAWKKFGIEEHFNAKVVNYVDDFVMCCSPHRADEVMQAMKKTMERIGLTVNESKTRIVKALQEPFDFLGYTFGFAYNKDNKTYWGTRPSKKAVKKVLHKIHEATRIQTTWKTAEDRVLDINHILRGWCNYFNQGPVLKSYRTVRKRTEKRLRRWLVKKHKMRGTTGYRQFPDEHLYGKLGLYAIAEVMADVPKAKA